MVKQFLFDVFIRSTDGDQTVSDAPKETVTEQSEIGEGMEEKISSLQTSTVKAEESKVLATSSQAVTSSTSQVPKAASQSLNSKSSKQGPGDGSITISVNDESKELYDITFTMSIAIAVPTGTTDLYI